MTELNTKDQVQAQEEVLVLKKDHSRIYIGVTLLTLLILTIYAFLKIFSPTMDWVKAWSSTFANFSSMFTQAQYQNITLSHALMQVLITFSLAIITTIVSSIISFFLALVVAENIVGGFWGKLIRGFVSFIRAVPTVLWVLIFARVTMGAEAAVMGIGFHSIGYLVKAYAESIEEMDNGVIEALRASGASWWQVVAQGVLPTTVTSLIAWTFLRFEINYMVALAMGAAAGAGGIGYDLFMAGSFYYNVYEVGAITITIIITTLILEFLSIMIRKRLRTV